MTVERLGDSERIGVHGTGKEVLWRKRGSSMFVHVNLETLWHSKGSMGWSRLWWR